MWGVKELSLLELASFCTGWCKELKEPMLSCQPANSCQSQPEVLWHCVSQTLLWQPALDNSKHQRAMRVGCTYWVVIDHHAVQQSGEGVEATCIQT